MNAFPFCRTIRGGSRSRWLRVAGLATTLAVGAAGLPAQTPESIFDEDPAALAGPGIPDRAEGFNRAMFGFNDRLYRIVFRPIARGYAAVVPPVARRGIGSFFHNLAFPTRFVGNVLEGKPGDAGVELGRFVVNSVTTLGFARTADRFPGLPEKPSDLGHAFGTWGIGHGTYLVLPVLGPTSVRDGVGQGISGAFLDPVRALDEWEQRAIANGLEQVNQLPELMENYDRLIEASIDPYIALRDAYSARRTQRTERKGEPPIPAATSTVTEP